MWFCFYYVIALSRFDYLRNFKRSEAISITMIDYLNSIRCEDAMLLKALVLGYTDFGLHLAGFVVIYLYFGNKKKHQCRVINNICGFTIVNGVIDNLHCLSEQMFFNIILRILLCILFIKLALGK